VVTKWQMSGQKRKKEDKEEEEEEEEALARKDGIS
jgi:hypothetical protein